METPDAGIGGGGAGNRHTLPYYDFMNSTGGMQKGYAQMGITQTQIDAARKRATALTRTTGGKYAVTADKKGNVVVVKVNKGGLGNPSAIVDKHGNVHTVLKPTQYVIPHNVSGTINDPALGNAMTNNHGAGSDRQPASAGSGGGDFTLNVGDPNVNQTISAGSLPAGAQKLDPTLASKIAGLQFDPQIADYNRLIKQQPIQGAQNVHDITNWYKQVTSAFNTAKDRASGVGQSAASGISNATQAILASMGGNANSGASGIAGAGADAAAMQSGIGEAQTNYLNDMQPLLQSEAAGAKTNETNRQSNLASDLAAKLAALKGQRGSAQASASLDISKYNNDVANQDYSNALNLDTYNNQARNQNWNNSLSAETNRIAALLTGAQVKNTTAGSSFTPWAKLDPAQRDDLIKAALSKVTGGQNELIYDPVTAMQRASKWLVSNGYAAGGNPNIKSALQVGISRANALKGQIDALNAAKTS